MHWKSDKKIESDEFVSRMKIGEYLCPEEVPLFPLYS